MIVERAVQDGVATVLINRPEVRNAINLEMVRELGAALGRAGRGRRRARRW